MIKYAVEVFNEEAKAILKLIDLLDDNFENIVKAILNSNGRVIISGIGKSGIIGKKISSSFASTGTPSFFLHPAEAFHGDLGMIKPEDIVILIANSGETDELLKLIPFLKDNNNIIISITGNPESTLALNSLYHLNIHVDKEVCPLNLAPTTSALTTLAMGDALTIALMEERKFKSLDYARFHPGGSLGRKLLTKAKDIMHTQNLPRINKTMFISDVIIEISKSKLGIAVVVENDKVIGVITDGDIRRQMQVKQDTFFQTKAQDIMNISPLSVSSDLSINEIEKRMKQKQVHSLIVLDNEHRLEGIIGYQDIY